MVHKIIILIWIHFIADFLLQPDVMALNKSKSIFWLLSHGVVYGATFIFFGFEFAILTALFHIGIDSITSRLTSYFWIKEKRHWFFVTIGFDQAIHITLLIVLLRRLDNGPLF